MPRVPGLRTPGMRGTFSGEPGRAAVRLHGEYLGTTQRCYL